MSLLDGILAHNARFVVARDRSITKGLGLSLKKIALFACMDRHLVEFLEPVMGIRRGDAVVVESAGSTLSDLDDSVIRSLVVAIFALGCEEVFVIGHRNSELTQIDDVELTRKMVERGIPQEAIAALQPSLRQWMGALLDPVGNIVQMVEMIRVNPLIPKNVPIHGMIFDPDSGRLELLTNGYS